jgi:SNF2-related domain/Helicase conserved C-terminal domain
VLFSKPRFEKEILDGSDKFGRKQNNKSRPCNCLFYRDGQDEPCICLREEDIYHSPLKDLHWLRIIIDEGHEFSSATSNAVLVAEKLVTAERRWVVSGTPARDRLYGVEADLAVTADYAMPSLYMDDSESLISSEVSTPVTDMLSIASGQAFKNAALERRRNFNPAEDIGNTSATKSIGLLAQHYLKLRPWYQDDEQQRAVWEDYIYRHEHFRSKTYTSFSACLRRTLQNLVIKTQPEDVERDIRLPPLTHNVVRLEPSFYDKLTANLFVFTLTANAVTSERTDVDYLFHKNSAKERYRLITNLRQSNFVWTGFSVEDLESAIKTCKQYLAKDSIKCTNEDRQTLMSCIEHAELVLGSHTWANWTSSHEVGLFVESWPDECGTAWVLSKCADQLMIGAFELIQAQRLVNNQLFTENPLDGVHTAGEAAFAALQIRAAEESNERKKNAYRYSTKRGIPSSAVQQETFNPKRTSGASAEKPKNTTVPAPAVAVVTASSSLDSTVMETHNSPEKVVGTPKLSRKRQRELDEKELDPESSLRKTSIVGTVSAKLTYLLDRISELYKDEKILVFYDGDNTAYYLSQCLDILHIKHLIYAKTLSSEQRSKYVVTFDKDDSIRVLLMDIQCGAYGLNVNKASRVFFINPVCRPSTEAQAIKRAHRIGQMKPVHVETLVLNGTIEAEIFERSKNMTQSEHFEAAQLSDDKGIARIIQTARLIPVSSDEGLGESQMAKLGSPKQIFGRPGRGDMKIRGIDRDLEVLDGSPAKKKPRPKKKYEVPDEKNMNIETVISGVDWMNQPIGQTVLHLQDLSSGKATSGEGISKSIFG